MTSRRVLVSKSRHVAGVGTVVEPDYEATFIQWGLELFEQEGESVNYSIAIVERNNGQVENVYPPRMQFLGKGGERK